MSVLTKLNRQREDAVARAANLSEESGRKKATYDAERMYRLSIERMLDEGHGSCVLLQPEAAAIVQSALAFFHEQRYSLVAWSAMPNHVHAVLKLLAGHTLADVVGSLKRYTSREINELTGRTGSPLWQEEYFDTLIRSPAHLERAVKYVQDNPSKAGFSDYSWAGVNEKVFASLLDGGRAWRAGL